VCRDVAYTEDARGVALHAIQNRLMNGVTVRSALRIPDHRE